MIIAIDMIGTTLGSGTKTYNLNFCEYVRKCELKNKIYIFITKEYSKEISLSENVNIKYIIKPFFLKYILLKIIWMQLILPFELKYLGADKFFSPMNMGPIFLRIFKIKFILALHSNLPWVYFNKMPGNILRNHLTKYLMEISISVCDKLIVDSEFAKNEIINLLKIQKEKVYVIHLGIDSKYLDNEENNYYLKDFKYEDYIISVLSCVKYHNILSLLKGFKILKLEKKTKIRFVFVMQILDKNYFNEINSYAKKNFERNEIIFLHNLNNDYLINLYKNANFYIFSSYCEVFGLTSLEAMSQGCPVLISNCSALPEINSNAAIYFDPDNENQIKDKMNLILSNDNYKKEITHKGNKHYQNFKWEDTVNKTINILENY